jgi:hypothetical protein
MKLLRRRHLSPDLWVLVAPLLILVAFLIGLGLFDVLGAGYLRTIVHRLFGLVVWTCRYSRRLINQFCN